MCSYNVEQARGDNHNILTVVMKENGVDLGGALSWVMTTYEQILSKFEEQRCKLPSWGRAIDSEVKRYVDRMCIWIRGHDCWSFESERYFGTKGVEIQRSRTMPLLPKISNTGVDPVMA